MKDSELTGSVKLHWIILKKKLFFVEQEACWDLQEILLESKDLTGK